MIIIPNTGYCTWSIPSGDLPEPLPSVFVACIESADAKARSFVLLTNLLTMGGFANLQFEAVKVDADGSAGTVSMPNGRPGDHTISLYGAATYSELKSDLTLIRTERARWLAS